MLGQKSRRFRAGGPAAFLLCLICGWAASATVPPGTDPLAADPLASEVQDFYNLRYDAAEQGLEDWTSKHPDDLRALSYLARVSLQREMLRRELLEAQAYGADGQVFRPQASAPNPQLRLKIFGYLNRLESAARKRLTRNPGDEDALYWMGASHVTRAIYNLTLEKSNMQALGEAKEAQKYHARLLKLDPECADAYLVIGTYDYVVGSLPWYTKAVAALIGYRGDRARGLKEIETAAARGHWARTDAETFLSILYFREKRFPEAIRILESLEQAYPENYVVPQEIARAEKAQNDWRSSARVYDGMIQKYELRAPGFAQLPAAKIYYQAGQVYAHLGESGEAHLRFQKAANLREPNNIYVYRAELAAAGIEMKENREAEARARFERVARAVPHTSEGRAAVQALRGFSASPGPRAGDSR